MANERPSFFSPIALLVLTVLLSGALYVLFPREAVYERIGENARPDALSLAYLEALLRSNPENDTLRLNLSRMQAGAGRPAEALATLAPLADDGTNVPFNIYLQKAELLAMQAFKLPAGADRSRLQASLRDWLLSAAGQPWTKDQQAALVTASQQWLPPREHLKILQRLFEDAQGEARLALGEQIALQQLALGHPRLASDTLALVLPLAPPARRAELQRWRIELSLAAEDEAAALTIFRQMHDDQMPGPDQLRRGIELASLAGDDELRIRWLKELAALEPRNDSLQRTLLGLQLGRGDLEQARETAQRLVANQRPPAIADLRQLALLSEWTDHPEDALTHWYALLQRTADREGSERAESLAAGLLDWPRLADLLQLRHRRRGLSEEKHILLADSLIRVGDLDGARSHLQSTLASRPQASLIRERLVSLLVGQRRLPEAIAVLEQAPKLSDTDRLQLATLYWRTRQPGLALRQLEGEFRETEAAMEANAMRIDLALAVGAEDQLRLAYDRLSTSDTSTLPPELQERLLNLALRFQDTEQALILADLRYTATGDSRYLAIRAELLLAAERWHALADTLSQWQQNDPGSNGSARFWGLKGELLQHLGELDRAEAALQQAARLAPQDREPLARWGWFLVSHPQRLPGALPRILDTLADNPADAHIPLLAWGHAALGQRPQSLQWFAEAGPAQANDPLWLLAHAEQLQQAGRDREAASLVQRVNRLGETRALTAAELLQFYRLTQQHRRTWPLLVQLHRSPQAPPNLADYALEQDQALMAEALLPWNDRQQPLYSGFPDYREEQDALQLTHSRRDLGRGSINATGLRGVISTERTQWRFSADTLSATDSGLLAQRPGHQRQGQLEVLTNRGPHRWSAALGSRAGVDGSRLTASLSLTTQPTDDWSLTLGHHYREATPDTAEAWWLTSRDRTYLGASYSPFSRLTLTQQLDHYNLYDDQGNDLGNGLTAQADARYQLFRSDPSWTLGVNAVIQRASITEASTTPLARELVAGTVPTQLFTEDYRRIGLSSEWQHGAPASLFRSTPSPRLFLRLDTGYVMSSSTTDFGAEAGLGWRLLGDDELAFSAGWTSQGPGLDDSRANLNLTYTLYLGK